MPTHDSFHLESRLTAHLNAFVYERLRFFFRAHPSHPLIKEFFVRNAFYSKVFVSVLIGQEPSARSFDCFLIGLDPDELYQDSLYLYHKWKEMGLDRAAFNYCQLINRLAARVPSSETGEGEQSVIDFCCGELEIRRYLHKLLTKKSDEKPKKRRKRRRHRNLAVNA